MEQFISRYLKVQGYAFAAISIIGACMISFAKIRFRHHYYELDVFYDFRQFGHWSIIIGICWLCVGLSLLYGLYKQDIRFLYPFPVMFCIELFLLLIRDIFMYYTSAASWVFEHYNLFLDPYMLVIMLYATLHVMFTIVALSRNFNKTPGRSASSIYSTLSFNWRAEPAASEAVLVEGE